MSWLLKAEQRTEPYLSSPEIRAAPFIFVVDLTPTHIFAPNSVRENGST